MAYVSTKVQLMVKIVREWLGRVEDRTLHIESGALWESSHIESF